MVQTKDDKRRQKKLEQNFGELRDLSLTVGVHSDAPSHTDEQGQTLNMAELAAVHEYGTSRIPERSFLRAGFDAHREDTEQRVNEALGKMIDGTFEPSEVLEYVGELLLGDIRETIAVGLKPDLAPMTKASRDKKAGHGGGLAGLAGSYTPLVDTGQLIGSLAYKVDTDDPGSR